MKWIRKPYFKTYTRHLIYEDSPLFPCVLTIHDESINSNSLLFCYDRRSIHQGPVQLGILLCLFVEFHSLRAAQGWSWAALRLAKAFLETDLLIDIYILPIILLVETCHLSTSMQFRRSGRDRICNLDVSCYYSCSPRHPPHLEQSNN